MFASCTLLSILAPDNSVALITREAGSDVVRHICVN
jgi:hypothetical protein